MTNYIKKIISKMSGKKKVFFLVENSSSASSTTRAKVICEQFLKMGVYSYVFDLKDETASEVAKIKEIKNSHVIFIKRAFKCNQELLMVLKENNNTLIWDPMDELMNLKEDSDVRVFDGVIWANKQCEKDVRSFMNKECVGAVIHHHWDPRCLNNNAKDYRLVFLGDPTPENINDEHVQDIKDLKVQRCSNIKDLKGGDLFLTLQDYNCHFSVREEGCDSFKYKPNSKLAIAAGTDSNIILSRDCSNVEILDESYPYYTDYSLTKTKEIVEYSKETFKTKIWDDALDMMKEVRERTSLEQIAQDYLIFLNSF